MIQEHTYKTHSFTSAELQDVEARISKSLEMSRHQKETVGEVKRRVLDLVEQIFQAQADGSLGNGFF